MLQTFIFYPVVTGTNHNFYVFIFEFAQPRAITPVYNCHSGAGLRNKKENLHLTVLSYEIWDEVRGKDTLLPSMGK